MKFNSKILNFHDYDPEKTPGDIKRDLTEKTVKYYSADGSAINLAEDVEKFGSGYHLDDGLYASAYLSNNSEVYAVLLDKETELVQKIDITDKIDWFNDARISQTLSLEFEKLSDSKVILNLEASASDLSQIYFASMVFSVNSDSSDAPRQLAFEGAKINSDFSLPAHYFGKSNGELSYVDSEFNIHRPFHDENGIPISLESYKGPIHLDQNYVVFLGATQVFNEPENFQYIYRVFDVDIGSFVGDIELAGKTEKPPYGTIEVISSGEGEILIELAEKVVEDFDSFDDISDGKAVISITSNTYNDITTFNSEIFEKSEDITASRANNFHTHIDNKKLLYVDQYFKEVMVLDDLGEFDNVFNQSSFFLDSGMVLLTVFTQKTNTDPQTDGYELKAAIYNPKNGSLETNMETVATLPSASEPSVIVSSVSSGELQMAVELDDGSKFAEIQITLPVIEMKSTSSTGDMEKTVLGSGDDVFFGSSEGDYVKSGGGSDNIKTGSGSDRVYVQSPSISDDENQETYATLMVTVGENSSGKNVYFIDGVEKPELQLEQGKVYHFDQSHPSNLGHPIALSGASDGFHSGSYNDMLGGMPYGNPGMPGSYTELMVTPADPAIFYFCESHSQMGNGANITSSTSVQDEPQVVEVDTGAGDDTVIVEDGWFGTLLVKNGSGSNVLEIGGNQEDFDVDIVDGKVQLTTGNGSTITIDEQHSLNEETGLVEISDKGFEYIKIDGHDEQGVPLEGEYAQSTYIVLGSNDANYLVANQPDDAESNDEVFVLAGDGADLIEASAHNVMIEGGEGDDTIRLGATSGKKSVFGDIFNGDSGGIVSSQNSSYADVVEIDWSYEASDIDTVAHGYRITNSELDAVVEVYDVEILKFANGDGTWDTRYLTNGAPVDKDSWMNGHAGKDIAYGDGSDVRFVLGNGTAPEGAALSDNGTSDILQVYANITTVTQQSYVYYQRGSAKRTSPAKGWARKTGKRDVESTEEALIWEGDRTAVDAFTFSDNVSINVINVADKSWNDAEIEYTLGTDGIDLIFGNDSDNLIDGKGGDDIIFGGDGEDVIIGGEGDDVLVGGAGDDIIRGDGVDAGDIAIGMFEDAGVTVSELSLDDAGIMAGNDTILGGDGVDDIESGEGKNLVASGRADMDGDGKADLDTIKEHMTTNKDIFEDDDWI